MKVVCVLRSGGRYTPEWPDRLYRQVRAHWPADRDLDFICISDFKWDAQYRIVPLMSRWPGWWAKMELFSPMGFAQGHGLYLDLDCVIQGSMWPIAFGRLGPEDGGFKVMRDPNSGGVQSAVMRWSGQWMHRIGWRIHDKFVRSPEEWMRAYSQSGDQQFIQTTMSDLLRKWSYFDVEHVASYKAHVLTGMVLNPSIIQFHGEPKMDELPSDNIYFRKWIDAA